MKKIKKNKKLKQLNLPDGIIIERLDSTTLNTVNEYKLLYPNWDKTKILRKINNTLKGKDIRFVAKRAGKIIGQVKVSLGKGIHSHRAELTSLIVLPMERGKGIGKAIMVYAMASLPKEIELALLSVDSKNKSAINLYKKMGFKKYGLLKKGSKIDGEYKNNIMLEKRI